MRLIALPWLALIAGPSLVFYLYQTFGKANRLRWIAISLACAILVAASFILGAIGLELKNGLARLTIYSVLYVCYCFSISSVLCIGSRSGRFVASVVAFATLIPGYLIATVGLLGFVFIVADMVDPVGESRVLEDGILCETSLEGIAGVAESESVRLYRYYSDILPFRWKLASVVADPTTPNYSSPSCEQILKSLK